MKPFLRTLPLVLMLALLGCTFSKPIPRPTVLPTSTLKVVQATLRPATSTNTPTPAQTVTPTITLTPTLTASPTLFASGPDEFTSNVNPLTGLPVANPALLELAPGLVSITNSPSNARPQSGLSYAAQVFEFYIGEGATRFLAVYYGEYPPDPGADGKAVQMGPIRSGRLHYEVLRQLYNGFLVFASAMQKVRDKLNQYIIVYNPDPTTINGAYIPVAEMLEKGKEMQQKEGNPALFGQRFDPNPPAGGKPAAKIWMDYNYYAQIFWTYDAQHNVYLRAQGDDKGSPPIASIDRLTGKQLGFENVIVLFTNYIRYSDVYFNIEFKYVNRWPAILFRDGQMYPMFWTTRADAYEQKSGKMRPMRFINLDGTPFALRPGHTWIEIVQLNNMVYETVDDLDTYRLSNTKKPGSGVWAVRFFPPDLVEEPKYPTPEQ
jgi:hypothetical protein